MKKFIYIVFLSIFLTFFWVFSGCASKNPLLDSVSQLNSNLYLGESQNYLVSAYYGFSENPATLDGKVGSIEYQFRIILQNVEISNQTYSVSFDYDGATYKKDLEQNLVSNKLEAKFNIENFNLNNLEITVFLAESSEKVQLNSIVNSTCKSYLNVLDKLYASPEIISPYLVDGKMTAEIHLRILEKNGKNYYYVGLIKKSNVKAFLMDAETLEVLAVRNVF